MSTALHAAPLVAEAESMRELDFPEHTEFRRRAVEACRRDGLGADMRIAVELGMLTAAYSHLRIHHQSVISSNLVRLLRHHSRLVGQAMLAFPADSLADSVAAAIEAGLRARQAEVEGR